MEDDEFDTETAETTDGDTVVVVESEETPAPDGDVIVEVVNVDDGAGDSETVTEPELDRWVELERWKTEQEQRIADAVEAAWEARFAAEDAAAAVEETQEAVVEVAEATDDAIVETIEDTEVVENAEGEQELEAPDESPVSQRVHWLFRERPFSKD